MSDAHTFRDAADQHPVDVPRLAAYLDRHGMAVDRDNPVRQFATGLANINYRLVVNGRDVVLRRPPDGDLPPGAHDMAREHRVLSNLSNVFPPAPDSMHLCEDRSIIGAPFQIMEYRPGLVIKGDDRQALGAEPNRQAQTASQLGVLLVDTMAALHAVDPAAAGLDTLGRPEGFVARAITGWCGRAQRLEPTGEMQKLVTCIGTWLEGQSTKDRAPTLLHCDIKLDNCILDPDTLALRALVDWDMGTRGDPLFDIATMLSYWTEPRDPPCMHQMAQMPTAASGFQTRDEIIALYAAKTGRDVSDYPVLRILCLFKLATVFHQLFSTYGRGPDARPEYAGFDRLALELYAFTYEVMQGRL